MQGVEQGHPENSLSLAKLTLVHTKFKHFCLEALGTHNEVLKKSTAKGE